MKVTFSINGNHFISTEIKKRFSERRLSSVSAIAASRTAWAIKDEWKDELSSFDRPTFKTLSSPKVNRADTRSETIKSEVYIDNKGVNPSRWISPNEFGSQRLIKKFEQALQAQGSMPRGFFAVPTPLAEKDGYGNVRRQVLVQILAQLGSQYSPGYQRVISKSASKRAERALATGQQYVAVTVRSGRSRLGRPGIYKRMPNGVLAPIFYYVGSIKYRKTVSLVKRAEIFAGDEFGRQFELSLAESIARLRSLP